MELDCFDTYDDDYQFLSVYDEGEDRPFYADISFDSGSDNEFTFTPSVGMSSDMYVQLLLRHIKLTPKCSTDIELICEDGTVTVPLFAIMLSFKSMINPIRDIYSEDSNIKVTLPCKTKSAEILKEVIFSGVSFPIFHNDLSTSDLSLFKKLGFRFDFQYISCGSESDSGTVDLEDSSYEEESEDEIEIDFVSIPDVNKQNQMNTTSAGQSRCSFTCLNQCGSVELEWRKEEIQEVKDIFKDSTGLSLKNKLINYLSVQSAVGKVINGYIIHGHEFCLDYFSYLTGLSLSVLKSVLLDYLHGVRLYEHSSKGMLRNPTTATMNFTVWLKNILGLIGQSAPDDEVIVINYWMKPKVLYSMYVNETPKPHIALKTFYHHLKAIFGPKRIDKTLPCHRISEYSSHSVCDECVTLNKYQKTCRTEAEIELVKSLRNEHKLIFGGARREVESLRQMALDFPEDSLMIQIDGMGNWSSYLPRYQDNSKSLAGTIRLATKVTGCIIWNGLYEEKRKDLFFINHDQFG